MAPGMAAGEHRRLPVCSSQVEDFIRDKRKQAHRGNLQRARTRFNNGWSVREEAKLETSRRNVKREQTEDERRADIKRENVRLLLRMQAIGENRAILPTGAAAAAPPPPPRSSSLPEIRRGSNVAVRMQELRRIDTENKKFLLRLRAAKPTVNMSRLEEQHSAQQKLMQMRSEFQSASNPRPRPPKVRYWDAPPVCNEDTNSECSDALMLRGGGVGLDFEEQPEQQWAETDVDTMDATDTAEEGQGAENAGRNVDPKDGNRKVVDELHPDNKRYGFVIPESSRLLTERLLEADDQERSVEADAAAAKEAAARAFREAAAVDADSVAFGGGELLSYDGVVRRLEDRGRRGISTRALQARAGVTAFARAQSAHQHPHLELACA